MYKIGDCPVNGRNDGSLSCFSRSLSRSETDEEGPRSEVEMFDGPIKSREIRLAVAATYAQF